MKQNFSKGPIMIACRFKGAIILFQSHTKRLYFNLLFVFNKDIFNI